MNDLYKERLRTAMQSRGIGGSDLARAVGIKPQAISQALSGSTKALTAANNALVADALNVDPGYLALGDDVKRLKRNAWGLSAEAIAVARMIDRMPADSTTRKLLVAQAVDNGRMSGEWGNPDGDGK